MLIQYNTGDQCTIHALNTMKCFAILFFCFLTERLVAIKCQTNDDVSGNVQLIDAYKAGVKTVPLPTIECGDRSAKGFSEKFLEIASGYIDDFHGIVHDQTQQSTNQMTDAIQKDVDKLIRSIESASKKRSNCLEHNLKTLTKQLRQFLKLNPGNVLMSPTPFPRPVQEVPVISRTTKRSLNDLFLNLCKVLDDDLSSLYGYITELFIAGRTSGRNQTGIAAMKLRNETLNGPIMDVSRHAAEIILENRATIQCHVKPKLWKFSKDVSERIIKISNDFNAS